MISYSLQEIADITGGTINLNGNLRISRLMNDSRAVTMPGDSLFFALTGRNHDGHAYIPELYAKGVKAFVISSDKNFELQFPDAGFIRVENTLRALQNLAARHRSAHNCPVIAITGSNGKTIVKEWLYHCLMDNFSVTRSPKSYNSQVGVPLSLWLLDKKQDVAFFKAAFNFRVK
jgi:alanine racemase